MSVYWTAQRGPLSGDTEPVFKRSCQLTLCVCDLIRLGATADWMMNTEPGWSDVSSADSLLLNRDMSKTDLISVPEAVPPRTSTGSHFYLPPGVRSFEGLITFKRVSDWRSRPPGRAVSNGFIFCLSPLRKHIWRLWNPLALLSTRLSASLIPELFTSRRMMLSLGRDELICPQNIFNGKGCHAHEEKVWTKGLVKASIQSRYQHIIVYSDDY